MVLDYKDVSFSFKDQKKKKLLRRVKIAAAGILVLLIFYFVNLFIESGRINKIQYLLGQNKVLEAETLLNEAGNSLLYDTAKTELRGLIQLYNREPLEAELTFKEIASRDSKILQGQYLDFFLDNAMYRELKLYTDFLEAQGGDTLFYQAIYRSALLDYKASRETLKKLSVGQLQEQEKVVRILNRLNDSLEKNRIEYIFDINGKPLAYFQVDKKQTVSLVPGIQFKDFTQDLEESIKYYKLTLDMDIQNKVHRLFKDYHGSFILMNLSDNSIAAAYSKTLDTKRVNSVFTQAFEPASIIKVITLFAYLNKSKHELFPIQCKGNKKIENKIFYDWRTHNDVQSPAQALAVSCNLAFAQMGLELGFPEYSKVLESFFFNSPGFSDLFLHFNTGKFSKTLESDYQLAKLSVGLTNNKEKAKQEDLLISTTTFHSALISALVAQNGSIYRPFIINSIKNHLDIGFYNHKPEILNPVNDNLSFMKTKQAMTAVVESARGTGRRSKVSFVKTALKTGTAGDRKQGYDAVITGFFPADRPLYAFALRLERAGKAEFKGAYFVKDFLESFYDK